MLAKAAAQESIQRNFQGMTTGGGLDLVGVGVSSISHFLEIGFAQNVKDVEAYQECADQPQWPAARGKWLTTDQSRPEQPMLGEKRAKLAVTENGCE